jgi:hypothetical protein
MTHLLHLAAIGVGLTPSELASIEQQISSAATIAADHAAAAATRRATEQIEASGAATKQTVYIGVGVAGVVGGLLGGYLGYRLAKR